MSDDIKQALKSVITGLVSSMDDEHREAAAGLAENKDVAEALKQAASYDVDGFYYSMIYPIENVLDGLLLSVSDNSRARFILRHSQFVDRQFNKVTARIDGSVCCSDRSRTIVKALLKHFMTGEEIVFDYEQEYTYHLPVSVFRTHDEIIAFFNGVHRLYYGNPDKYIECLRDFIVKEPVDG